MKRRSVQLEALRHELGECIRSYEHLSGDEWLPLRSDYDTAHLPPEFTQALRELIAVKRKPSSCAAYKLEKLAEMRQGPLQSFDLSLKIIHVGGTNGKGTVASKIAYGLSSRSYKVGLLTSPHLLSVRERTLVNGVPIRLDEWMGIYTFLKKKSKESNHVMPWFELLTMLSMLHFWLCKCKYVVCEVGLGGRKDSTNVFPAKELSVITSIGLDHQEILGESLEAIAKEKAGILRPSGIAVLGPSCQGLTAFKSIADTTLVFVPPGRTFVEENNRTAQLALSLLLKDAAISTTDLPEVPGRFELLGVLRDTHTPIILDVGHNISALQEVARMIRHQFPSLEHLRVLAALSRHRKLGIFDPLLSVVGREATELIYLPCEHELLQRWSEKLNDGSESWAVFSRSMVAWKDLSLKQIVSRILTDADESKATSEIDETSLTRVERESVKSLILFSGSLFSVAEILTALNIKHFSPIITKDVTIGSNASSSSTTDGHEMSADCLWTFHCELPRSFTLPVVAEVISDKPSIFFLRSYLEEVHDALSKQSDTIWYALDESANNLKYPEEQRGGELVGCSWVRTLQALIDSPIAKNIARQQIEELSTASESPPATQKELADTAGEIDVYVQGSEMSVMKDFLVLIAKGLDSLTGSKRKYVEVEMNLKLAKVVK